MRGWMGLGIVGMIACGSPDASRGDRAPDVEWDSGDAGAVDCLVGVEVDQCPSDVSLVDADGRMRTFSEFRSRPVLVMSTAAWCPGCDALLHELYEWSVSDAPDDLEVLLVITQSTSGGFADAESARLYASFVPDWTVVGDHTGAWNEDWSGDHGIDQYIYGLLDETGRVVWRRADGWPTTVDEVDQETWRTAE